MIPMNEFAPLSAATHAVSRRRLLRGLGTLMSLPFLESLAPRLGAAEVKKAAAKPLRAAWLYIPNGVNVNEWFPTGEGDSYTMSNSLKELEKHRADFSVVSGLMQDWAHSHGNGGGDHARAVATFLTGCQPKKTAGADIHLGISADQIAANKIGHLTRLPSLELSTDGQRSSGKCDSGYSCAYQFVSARVRTFFRVASATCRALGTRMHIDNFYDPVSIGFGGCDPEVDWDRAGETDRIC